MIVFGCLTFFLGRFSASRWSDNLFLLTFSPNFGCEAEFVWDRFHRYIFCETWTLLNRCLSCASSGQPFSAQQARDSRYFQGAESVRSGNSHVTSQPVSFPPHPVPGGMLSRSIGMPSRREGPPSIWDTHGISGNVFADPVASSTAPNPQELNPWSSGRVETIR